MTANDPSHRVSQDVDFDDFFTESEATRENYLWKYYNKHGRPRLTPNPNEAEFQREVFGLEYTIVSYGDPDA